MKKWIPFAAGAAVVLAAVVLALIFGLFGGSQVLPQPVLYMDGDDLYLAVGENTLLLDDAAVEISGTSGTLCGEFSTDSQYLYYLVNKSEDGMGTLMAVDTQSMTTSRVADGVYFAMAGGSRVLYLAELDEDGTGTLYSAETGKEPELIADAVMTNFLGFSRNNQNIYYTTLTDSGDSANPYHLELYIKVGGNQPVLRLEIDGGGDIQNTLFGQIVLGNGGELLFTRVGTADEQESGEYVLTLNANGSADDFGNATIVQTFENPDEFFYVIDSELYYMEPGANKVRLSENYDSVLFAPYYGAVEDYVPDNRFLLVEQGTNSDGTAQEQVTLYEQEIGEDKVQLADADPGSAVLNPQFSAVCFTDEGEMYLMIKKGGQWSSRVSICDSALGWIFDRSGEYLYYIEKSSADAADGDLISYRLSDGNTTTLLYDAQTLSQTGAGLFSQTSDGAWHWLDGKGDEQQFPDDTQAVKEAAGGYFAAIGSDDGYDILYYETGADDGITICYNAIVVKAGGFTELIDVTPSDSTETGGDSDTIDSGQSDTQNDTETLSPETMFASIGLDAEQSSFMSMILADLLYYSDLYCGTDYSTITEPVYGYDKGLPMLEEMLEGDLSYEAQLLTDCVITCFESIEYYENADEEYAQGYMVSVESSLEIALDCFEMYVNTGIE